MPAALPVDLLYRFLGIFAVVAAGWLAGRRGWLGPAGGSEAGSVTPAQVLSDAAFVLFMPALLFRTTARIDLAALPWQVLAVFFLPVIGLMLVLHQVMARRQRRQAAGARADQADSLAARPAIRAITAGFGNTVQLGIPVAAALFGPEGLAIHLAVVSLHALSILVVTTALVETDIARSRARRGAGASGLAALLIGTMRRTVIHPVVLPVLAGLVVNALGWALPAPIDETLVLLAQAAVPVCLVLLGLSFAEQGLDGLRAVARPALVLSALKLLALPVVVLGMGLALDLPNPALAVIVMCAALPTGSNALIFAQRYRALGVEVSVTTVLSTLAYALTAPLWLTLLAVTGRT